MYINAYEASLRMRVAPIAGRFVPPPSQVLDRWLHEQWKNITWPAHHQLSLLPVQCPPRLHLPHPCVIQINRWCEEQTLAWAHEHGGRSPAIVQNSESQSSTRSPNSIHPWQFLHQPSLLHPRPCSQSWNICNISRSQRLVLWYCQWKIPLLKQLKAKTTGLARI